MKILNTEDLAFAAETLAEAGKLDAKAVATATQAIEEAQGALADMVAKAAGVIHNRTALELGFGGLCSDFEPGEDGTTCDIIGDGDPGGEWGNEADEDGEE